MVSDKVTRRSILDIVTAIQSNMDTGKFPCGVFGDLKKAFDTVDHGLLLQKLAHYGFQGLINDWFRSYLQAKTELTVVGKRLHYSHTRSSLHGSLPKEEKPSFLWY